MTTWPPRIGQHATRASISSTTPTIVGRLIIGDAAHRCGASVSATLRHILNVEHFRLKPRLAPTLWDGLASRVPTASGRGFRRTAHDPACRFLRALGGHLVRPRRVPFRHRLSAAPRSRGSRHADTCATLLRHDPVGSGLVTPPRWGKVLSDASPSVGGWHCLLNAARGHRHTRHAHILIAFDDRLRPLSRRAYSCAAITKTDPLGDRQTPGSATRDQGPPPFQRRAAV